MHKAKGLDACVVFVPAAEEEMYVRDPAVQAKRSTSMSASTTRIPKSSMRKPALSLPAVATNSELISPFAEPTHSVSSSISRRAARVVKAPPTAKTPTVTRTAAD